MLLRVEEAGLGIAACRLPTRDDGAGRLVEPSVDLGVEAETGQRALHVAALCLVEAYLVFGLLSCLGGNGRRIGGRQLVAVSRARTGLGGICTDENSQDRQCQDEDTQWLSSLILKSLDDFALRTDVGSNTPPLVRWRLNQRSTPASLLGN